MGSPDNPSPNEQESVDITPCLTAVTLPLLYLFVSEWSWHVTAVTLPLLYLFVSEWSWHVTAVTLPLLYLFVFEWS